MRLAILATIAIVYLNIFVIASKNDQFLTQITLANRKEKATFETYSYDNHPFKNWTNEEVKRIMGVTDDEVEEKMDISLVIGNDSDLPKSFDARNKWPNCVSPIRNQGKCGSSYALSGTSVFSDRICITSKSKLKVNLSAQDVLECTDRNNGCNGGNLMNTWMYFTRMGTVTEECNPYSAEDGTKNFCIYRNTCIKPGISKKKYQTINVPFPINWFTTVEEIKKEIMKNGPIQSAFQVYEDFLDYKGGIYTHNTGKFLGGHSVKIVGWGLDKEKGTAYWIAANTWGIDWGEKGYFRIKMGQCGIEKLGIALVPDLSNDYKPPGFLKKSRN
jgi:cathepsin B